MPPKLSKPASKLSETDAPPCQTRGDIKEKATIARATRLKKGKASLDSTLSLHKKRIQNIKRIQRAQEEQWGRAAEEANALRVGDEFTDANTSLSLVEGEYTPVATDQTESVRAAVIDINKFDWRHYPVIYILTLGHFLHYIYHYTLSLFYDPKGAEELTKDNLE